MGKTVISTDKAAAAVGPYNQAVKCGNFIFTSGQIGIDPAAGKLEDGLEAQAKRALDNLTEVLKAGGGSLEGVVKTTIFLADMGDFAAVNNIYKERFTGDYPARSTVAVKQLPLGALVEIEAVAEVL